MFHLIVISVALLFTVTDVVECSVRKSIVPVGTWLEAYYQCKSEGAEFSWPYNEQILNEMKSLIKGTNATYHIGAKSGHHSRLFTALEGVPLKTMTMSLWQYLDPWNGDCLAMTEDSVHVVSCETRLPYFCSDPLGFNAEKTNCGPGYTYDLETKHCYKLHNERLTWIGAQMACVAEGGNLVVIDDDIEAKSYQKYAINYYSWTGLWDYTRKGDWISVHWQRVQYLFNTWFSHSDLECGVFCQGYHLHSWDCNHLLDFVCEKEPTY